MSIKIIEESIVVVLLALLIILVFIAASLRWFGISVAWSIDTAQLLFVWVCFIGADLALRTNRHVGVDMLIKKFPFGIQNSINLFCNILIFGFLMIVLYFGLTLCIDNYQRHFNTIPISYSFVTGSAPVGSLLMGLTIIGRIKNNVMNIIHKDYSSLKKEQTLEGGQII